MASQRYKAETVFKPSVRQLMKNKVPYVDYSVNILILSYQKSGTARSKLEEDPESLETYDDTAAAIEVSAEMT